MVTIASQPSTMTAPHMPRSVVMFPLLDGDADHPEGEQMDLTNGAMSLGKKEREQNHRPLCKCFHLLDLLTGGGGGVDSDKMVGSDDGRRDPLMSYDVLSQATVSPSPLSSSPSPLSLSL